MPTPVKSEECENTWPFKNAKGYMTRTVKEGQERKVVPKEENSDEKLKPTNLSKTAFLDERESIGMDVSDKSLVQNANTSLLFRMLKEAMDKHESESMAFLKEDVKKWQAVTIK